MKNHIGKLLMLATMSFAFSHFGETFAMHRTDSEFPSFYGKSSNIPTYDITEEVWQFLNDKAEMDRNNGDTLLKLSDLNQARANHINGIEVLDDLKNVGDSVSIGVIQQLTIVE